MPTIKQNVHSYELASSTSYLATSHLNITENALSSEASKPSNAPAAVTHVCYEEEEIMAVVEPVLCCRAS